MKRALTPLALLIAVALGLAACGGSEDEATDTAAPAATSEAAPAATSAAAPATSEAAPATSEAAPATSAAAPATSEATPTEVATTGLSAQCAKDALALKKAGTLTVGTDKPSFPPYVIDDDPTNGKGFESAVAYAVAAQLGFSADEVTWAVVPFNKSYAPGAKDFDFDINQVSITEERAKAVDFSDPYYTAPQAVLTVEGSKIAGATTLAELKDAKLGAQVGTSSLAAGKDLIAPSSDIQVYDDSAAATAALKNGQIDGVLVDLPTALYLAAAEVDGGKVVGQFSAPGGDEWGLLLEKGSGLTGCLNEALAALTASGELAAITQEWMADSAGAPVLQ